MSEIKAITLTLVGWQKRMIRDYVKGTMTISKVTIPVIDTRQWRMYMQPDPIDVGKGAWNLYLTDAQSAKVSKVLGVKTPISALLVSPEMVKSGAIAFE